MDANIHAPTHEEFTIVERVASIISSVRGSKPDYTRLASELELAVPFDVLGIVLLRHDGQAVRVTVCQHEQNSWKASPWKVSSRQHPLADSRFEQLLHSPRLLVSQRPEGLDGPPAKTGDALSGHPYLHAMLIAPLLVGGRVLGTLELGSTRLNVYTDGALQRLVQAVADVLATAIENAQMGGSAAIQDRQRQALKDVSSALTSKTDLLTILHHIVDGIANALNVASAIITFDQQQRVLRLQAQSGLDEAILRQLISCPTIMFDDQSIIGATLRHRQPLVSHDLSTDDRYPTCRAFFSELGVRSLFSYPLVTDMTVYGVLLLCSPEPGGFTPLKGDILSLFASQATIAIHNSMLLEAAQQRRRFQSAIEQLERAQASAENDSQRPSEVTLEEEYALLLRVREEAQHTFGVSFSSLLRFIADHLLTRSERDVQALLDTEAEAETQHGSAQPSNRSHEESLALLTSTAEAALARASMISNVGAALAAAQASRSRNPRAHQANHEGPRGRQETLLQLSHYDKGDGNDAWFAIDLDGYCLYMNHPAEIMCGVHMEHFGGPFISSNGMQHVNHHMPTFQQLMASLLPRIRNSEEVNALLNLQDTSSRSGDPRGRQDPAQAQDTQGTLTCRCVLAAEPVQDRSSRSGDPRGRQETSTSLLLESAPTDHHYQLTRYPLYDPGEQLIAYALQIHDITEHVRDEKNKSALLSSVSHDLRTPLATIKAAVSGLLQPEIDWDEETRRKILAEIEAETDHLTILVTALVDMSRIEMGALALDKEWCDAVEIVNSNLDRLECVLDGRPVRKDFQSDLPLVYVDHLQLGRVFYNLVENAVRHSPENSELVLTLNALGDPHHPHTLRAQVIDHGVGVPEEERERIFRSFYGFSSRGNGLGLAICKGIIEAHQGRIWVETAPDGGACFTFTLPAFGMLQETPVGAGLAPALTSDKSSLASSLFSSVTVSVDISSEEQR